MAVTISNPIINVIFIGSSSCILLLLFAVAYRCVIDVLLVTFISQVTNYSSNLPFASRDETLIKNTQPKASIYDQYI